MVKYQECYNCFDKEYIAVFYRKTLLDWNTVTCYINVCYCTRTSAKDGSFTRPGLCYMRPFFKVLSKDFKNSLVSNIEQQVKQNLHIMLQFNSILLRFRLPWLPVNRTSSLWLPTQMAGWWWLSFWFPGPASGPAARPPWFYRHWSGPNTPGYLPLCKNKTSAVATKDKIHRPPLLIHRKVGFFSKKRKG